MIRKFISLHKKLIVRYLKKKKFESQNLLVLLNIFQDLILCEHLYSKYIYISKIEAKTENNVLSQEKILKDNSEYKKKMEQMTMCKSLLF